jgi:pyridoxal phosphate enzyme (YggS family)
MDGQAGDSIEDRLTLVFRQIHRAIHKAGRQEGSVQLVAATKAVSVDRIRQAIAAGLKIIGENRLQEALPKIEALKGEPIEWHFIGGLQRRKVRSVVGVFDLIHSVDSVELAQEVDRRAEPAGVRQNILLEINLGKEKSKAGFLDDDVERALPQLGELNHVVVKGLMAIPPPVRDAEEARPYFRHLRELALRLTRQGIPRISMAELSMGMSNDYVVAVEEGATLIRVGTAIFGARHD